MSSSRFVPLVISLTTVGTRGERIERRLTVAWYRGRTGRSLVYEPEVHGTFDALLWRARRRTWQRFRKREMPQGGLVAREDLYGHEEGGGRIVRKEGRNEKTAPADNTHADVVVVIAGARCVRRRNWRKLSVLAARSKTKDAGGELWKALSDYV